MVLSRALPFLLVASLCSCSDSQGAPTQPTLPVWPDAAADAPPDSNPGQDAAEEAWTPAPLRVVSWNVHDLFDNIAGNCDCAYEPLPPPTANEYDQKIASVAGVLSKLDGDVLMLQEVENEGVLDKLASSSALASSQYQYRHVLPGNDPRGINIAFMSRYPTTGAFSHKDDQFTREDNPSEVYRYTRDALEVHMQHRGKHLVFLGVHFKAKSNPDDPDKRLAEAQYTRKLADNLLNSDPSCYVFVLGDFNDTTGSPPFLAVQNGMNGPPYVDAAGFAPAADQYTYIYSGQHQLIDHLFASSSAALRLDKSTVAITHGSLPSDHAPVSATFQVP